MGLSLSIKKKKATVISIALLSFLCGGAFCSYALNDVPHIIWLDFRLPPHYEKERKEIVEATKQRPDKLERWSKVKNFDFDAMAVADLDGDGRPDVAFVVIEIAKPENGPIAGIFAKYEKYKGEWTYSTEVASTGDMYYIKDKKGKPRLVTDGCVMTDSGLDYYSGPCKSLTRDGKWLPYFRRGRYVKIRSIVEKELGPEIAKENQEYKERYELERSGLAIAGVFEDVNGDGKPDIIVRMNDINRGPGTANPLLPFCDETDCDYYLLLNKGNNKWQKELLGRISCVGLSKPDKNGARQIYIDQATLVWDGAKYNRMPYKTNWMIKEPIKPEDGLL